MLTYESTTIIQASPAAVWGVLVDLQAFPEWDPNCISITGELVVGQTLEILTSLSPNRAFKADVVAMETDRKMVWQGGMPLGMFRGVRTFELEALPDGTTKFTTREEFSGWMSPLINKTIPDMTDAFDAFTQGLKKRTEAEVTLAA